jgi:amidase
MPGQPTCNLATRPAWELAAQIRAGHLSATELTEACLAQVERHNPGLNALVTVDAEGALAKAAAADRHQARGGPLGPLHGLPVAHKDSFLTAGMRTTWGSQVYAEHVPSQDSLIVSRQAAAGSILLGKSNLPEFGAGSQTFNEVFGATRNPYAPAMTWPRAWWPWPTAATWVARCATRRVSATSSACAPPSAAYRTGPTPTASAN